jgi:hypothetical protein
MCGMFEDTLTPVTRVTATTVRVPRSQQVNSTTGLTLNEQRRIETRVRRGAQLLDAIMPGWAARKPVLRDLKTGTVEVSTIDDLVYGKFRGGRAIHAAGVKAGYNFRSSTLDVALDGEPIVLGAEFGFFGSGDFNDAPGGESLTLNRAWTRAVQARQNVTSH